MRLVTINGPLGSGKSWTANKLEGFLSASSYTRVERVSFQDPLRIATMALLGVTGMDYDQFKISNFLGLTGRAWMIKISEELAKPIDPNFFSKVMLSQLLIRANDQKHFVPLFVADSNGFEVEIDFLRGREEIDLLTCCIEPPGSPPRGELWTPGDSRVNLAHKCAIVAKDSNELYGKLIAALERRGWIR